MIPVTRMIWSNEKWEERSDVERGKVLEAWKVLQYQVDMGMLYQLVRIKGRIVRLRERRMLGA